MLYVKNSQLCPNPRSFPAETDSVAGSYAVYFKTLPVHLWGRRGEDGTRNSPPIASAPARRLEHAWSQVTFVPGHAGELLFVQGWSNRVLLTSLPKVESRQFVSARSNSLGAAAGGRLGLLDGSRVVALDGHEAQASRGEGAHDTYRTCDTCAHFFCGRGVGSVRCERIDRSNGTFYIRQRSSLNR